MRLKSLALAAAVVGFGAASAQAATVTWLASDETSTMDVAVNLGLPQGVSYTWKQAPSTGWISFDVDSSWALQLFFYGVGDDTPPTQQVSGYVLKVWDAVSSAWTNLTTDSPLCSTSTLAPVAGDCNLIASELYDGGDTVLRPGEKTGALAAGRYLLGVYDSGEPSNTSALFYIAAVPLPATGLGLMAGLAGLAALGARRRRQTAA